MKRKRYFPFLLCGSVFFIVGILTYLIGVLLSIPRYLLNLHFFLEIQEFLVWYSGIPIVISLIFACIDFFLLFNNRRLGNQLRETPLKKRTVTVVLTAYNDEESIAEVVSDFKSHPNVDRVIVVSNNSNDKTLERAKNAGAITFNEEKIGYGQCVYRCLTEALKFEDAELIVLCEGDLTFRSFDIEKLLAYIPHADIAIGTRTSERLRQYSTQLSTFMLYGNIFVAKILEVKHFGRCTLTDVGTTFKLCRRESLKKLLPLVNPNINLEFNAHFMDFAIDNNIILVECPITFHPRVGVSKGGNINNWRGFIVGLMMLNGIIFGWKKRYD